MSPTRSHTLRVPVILVALVSIWVVTAGASDCELVMPHLQWSSPLSPDSRPRASLSNSTGELFVAGEMSLTKFCPMGQMVWEQSFLELGLVHPYFSDMCLDNEGNIYFAGQSDEAGFLIKCNGEGQIVWHRSTPPIRKVRVGENNSVYAAGSAVAANGYTDLFLGKYTEHGDSVWSAFHDGPLHRFDELKSLEVSPAGSVYITGYTAGGSTYQPNGTGEDWQTAKYSGDGLLEWARLFSGPTLPGYGSDHPVGMCFDPLGNVFVYGMSDGGLTPAGESAEEDIFVLKYSASGDSLWATRYGGSGNGEDRPISAFVDESGQLRVGGRVREVSHQEAFILLRYDTQGVLQLKAPYYGPGARFNPKQMQRSPDGKIWVAGESGNRMETAFDEMVLEFDAEGNLLWDFVAGHSGEWYHGCSIAPGPLGEIVGWSTSGESGEECFAFKLVEDQCLPVDIFPGSCPNIIGIGSSDVRFHGMHPEPTSVGPQTISVAVLGSKVFDVTRIDPATLTLAGVSPTWHKYADVAQPIVLQETECECSPPGVDGWTDLVLQFCRDELIAALSPYADGEFKSLTLVGQTKTGVPISGTDCVTITQQPIRVSSSSSATVRGEMGFATYPNPFNASTVISFSNSAADRVRLEVYNVLGQRVVTLVDAELPAGLHEVVWDARGVASGVYFAQLTTQHASVTRQMIVMK